MVARRAGEIGAVKQESFFHRAEGAAPRGIGGKIGQGIGNRDLAAEIGARGRKVHKGQAVALAVAGDFPIGRRVVEVFHGAEGLAFGNDADVIGIGQDKEPALLVRVLVEPDVPLRRDSILRAFLRLCGQNGAGRGEGENECEKKGDKAFHNRYLSEIRGA